MGRVLTEGAPAAGPPRAWPALAALAAAGLLLALLPHAIALWTTGDPTYLADGDELLYLAWSRPATLHGVPAIRDAVHPAGGPMMHPWPLFVPPALLAHALGVGMTGLGPIWRSIAGVSISWALYAAARPWARGPWSAAGAAAFLMFDAGLLFGQVGWRGPRVLGTLAAGSEAFFDDTPYIMAHLRVVTPALALPFWIAHLALAARAREVGSARAVAAAAASFGLLFHVYFYFWTTAAAGLALAAVLDRDGRRTHAWVLLGGLALGAPAVASGYLAKASTPADWLLRTDKFAPVGAFSEWIWPWSLAVPWAVSGAWVLGRRRDLIYPWCCVGAGLALVNHQAISRLQIENYHWTQAYGVGFSLLLARAAIPPAVAAAGRPGRRGAAAAACVAAVAVQAATGLALRGLEATRTRETVDLAAAYRRYRAEAFAPPPGSVLAGDPGYLALAAALGDVYPLSGRLVEYSSKATDGELDERLILNLYLSGDSAEAARAKVRLPAGTLSREAHAIRTPAVAEAQRGRRLALVERIWVDPSPWVSRYGVTHAVAAVDPSRPGGPAALARLGRRVAAGRAWDLWAIGAGAAPIPISAPESAGPGRDRAL